MSISKYIIASGLIGVTQSNFAQKIIRSNVNESKPNIVWIMAEDICPRLSCYGDSLAHTPTIDRLANEGIVFTNAFTCAGVCAPSRVGIITGMYATSIGAQHMRQAKSLIEFEQVPQYNAVPPSWVKAFPEYLRKAGYYCTNARKTDYQFGTPFTIWDECNDNASWRTRPEKEMPFFSCFTFESTHEINVWTDADKLRFFKDNKVDTARLVKDVKKRPFLPEKYITDPKMVVVPPYYPDTKIVREDMARHYTNISRMDTQVGDVIRKLKEDNLLENTIIFFMGDNGDGLPRAKRWMYDTGIKVPLIIWCPSRFVQQRDTRLISLTDLAPTVLALAGVDIPEYMHGKDIFGELMENPHKYIFAGRDRMDDTYDMIRAIRSKEYKYIRNFEPEKNYTQPNQFLYRMPMMQEIIRLEKVGELNRNQSYWLFNQKPAEELYNIINDPQELTNLAANPAYSEILKTLRADLYSWMISTGDWGMVQEKNQADLMWPGLAQPKTSQPTFTSDASGYLTIDCPTAGASISYKYISEKPDRWRIYSKPVILKKGEKIVAKAVRYGYEESKISEFEN